MLSNKIMEWLYWIDELYWPFPVENEAELKASVTALTHPRVDEDADVFARHGENGFGKSGRWY